MWAFALFCSLSLFRLPININSVKSLHVSSWLTLAGTRNTLCFSTFYYTEVSNCRTLCSSNEKWDKRNRHATSKYIKISTKKYSVCPLHTFPARRCDESIYIRNQNKEHTHYTTQQISNVIAEFFGSIYLWIKLHIYVILVGWLVGWLSSSSFEHLLLLTIYLPNQSSICLYFC